jgi:hypothetical protein
MNDDINDVSLPQQTLRDLLHAYTQLECVAMLAAHQANVHAGHVGGLAALIRALLDRDTATIDWRLIAASIAGTCERLQGTALENARTIRSVLDDCSGCPTEPVSLH